MHATRRAAQADKQAGTQGNKQGGEGADGEAGRDASAGKEAFTQ